MSRPGGPILRRTMPPPRIHPAVPCAAALLAAWPAAAAAAQRAMPRDLPSVQAVRASGPITIDGRLTEPAWQAATPITTFTQVVPDEGQPVSQPTEVRILFDRDALYVGAVLYDTIGVASRLGRRDAYMEDSDWLSIALDTYHDHLTAVRFMVNPAGVRSDGILSGGDDEEGDESWDPVWEVETAVWDGGWSVEMRIPFSQLRFRSGEEQLWGLQLERTIARRQEEAVFAFTPRSERGGIARYGHLTGIRGIDRGRGLDLLPYSVARAEYAPAAGEDGAPFADPYRDGADYFASLGLDLKYRLAWNLTLDATFNPDFGQVEVDPAVVNLTAFETQFEEKRPFFVEGSDIFDFGGGTELLYSRRIGGAPRWSAPGEALYESVPDAATILGAAKLTGRTAGWTVGLIEAVTAEETGRYITAAGDEVEEVAAPLTSWFAGRVQRNLREGRTTVGALITAVNRRLGGLPLAQRLRASAYAGGIDFRHEWADRAWVLSGHVAASRIAGEPEAIEAAQRSSARYFQRPDADHLRLDPTATTLTGYDASIELSKESGLHWRGDLELSVRNPGFEVNDLGFQQEADRIETEGSIRYVEQRPGRVFREWSIELEQGAEWNHGRDFLGGSLSLEAEAELLNYWSGEVGVSRGFAGLDDRLTRGGPLTRSVARTGVFARVESDSRMAWTLEADVSYDRDDAGGDELGLELGLSFRPSDAWSLSFGPEVSRERTVAQYVGSVEDPTATHTFGRRYLFASLEQNTLALEARLNVTFRPGLTLEVYAQPLIASGAFGAVKELRAPRTFSFLTYGRDIGIVEREGGELTIDPDGAGPAEPFTVEDEGFSERSLRGNAVLRWEWRPGSTLFLVWQQSREHEDRSGALMPVRDLRALARAPGRNVLLLKVSYWISP